MLRRLFRSRKAHAAIGDFALSAGRRAYAIGDVHGRLDLLDPLLDAIAADDRERQPAPTTIIFLGDLVDRGPQSRQVVERAMRLRDEGGDVRFLKGNHEEIFITAYQGDRKAAGLFHRVGGRDTMLSYGLSEREYDGADLNDLPAMMRDHVPADHIEFLDSFSDMHVDGQVAFVHAGIKPGVALEEQSPRDLRWIRSAFLNDENDHGYLVIHGHSISDDVMIRRNRIGIDTGAYASGRLAAIGLEGAAYWFLISDSMSGVAPRP